MAAEKISKIEFAGVGCAIQGAGLLAPAVGSLAGIIGVTIGLFVMVALLLVGSAKSKRWLCGSCRNPLASKEVRICPACREPLV